MLLTRADSSGDWHENSSLEMVKVGRVLDDVEGYYALLGVEPSATDKEVRKAGKHLVMQTHPDVGGDEEEFIKTVEAYRTLSNPGRRAEYDTRTKAPTVSVKVRTTAFVPDIPREHGPAWYKEPTMIVTREIESRVKDWHEMLLEAARGFRLSLEIKAGVCRCPAGYHVENGIALIGSNQVPEGWAARVFMLMKLCERK